MPLSTERKYLVVDPLHAEPGDVDTGLGNLKAGSSRYMTVNNPEIAAEIKAKKPWYLVTENAGWKNDRRTFQMPALPWKYDLERHLAFAEMYNEYYKELNATE